MRIWMDNVQCSGTEHYLSGCNFGNGQDWGHSSCRYHNRDAGVVCAISDYAVPVRLSNGTTNNEGRVEININGHWGTICDVYWDTYDASVICRQLGYDGKPPACLNACRMEHFHYQDIILWVQNFAFWGQTAEISKLILAPTKTSYFEVLFVKYAHTIMHLCIFVFLYLSIRIYSC